MLVGCHLVACSGTLAKPLLSYAYRFPNAGHYNCIAGLAALENQALDPFKDLLRGIHNLLLHRSNRFLNALLDDKRVDGNLLFRGLFLDLESLGPYPADRGAYSLADLARGFALKLDGGIHHHDHCYLAGVFLDDGTYGVPRFSHVPTRTLGLQGYDPPFLYHSLGDHHVLLHLPLLLILHQLRSQKRSYSVAYGLAFGKGLGRAKIGLRLLHDQREERLELEDDEETACLSAQ